MTTIGIDYTPAYEQGGGIGRLTRELMGALARRQGKYTYRLFVAGARRNQLTQSLNRQFSWCPTTLTPKTLARVWHRAHLPLPIEVFTGRVNLFHATDFTLPPTLPATKTLLTVHDLSFVRVPETASPPLKEYLDAVVPRSVHRADHILADSQATKDDLIELYRVAPDKISVLLSGVDARFRPVNDIPSRAAIREKYGIGHEPYIFTIGTVQPRKNYTRLIEALAEVRKLHDVSLVIAGGKGWLEDDMYRALDRLHMHDHVHLIGFAHDADLPTLYSDALCLAFPSLYEGFGLPILEAMACGIPVLTSNVSSMPEAAGDAALLVDPRDTPAITKALIRLISDSALRASLVQLGFAQAKRFTWDKSAEELAAIYETLLRD